MRWTALSLAALLVALGAARGAEPATQPGVPPSIAMDSPMLADPKVGGPEILRDFPAGAERLWLEALARPDAPTRRQGADAIATAAHEKIGQLKPCVDPLRKLLGQESDAGVRLSAARGLVAMDARETQDAVLAANRDGTPEMIELTDPALARWRTPGAGELWLARVEKADASRAVRTSAARSLAAVSEIKAVAALRTLIEEESVRGASELVYARALMAISKASQDTLATKVAARVGAGVVDRVVAVTLLDATRSPAAKAALARLLLDEEPAVALLAGEHLLKADAGAVAAAAENLRARADVYLHVLAVRARFLRHAVEDIAALDAQLADRYPEAADMARDALAELDRTPALHGPVQQMIAAGITTKKGPALVRLLLVAGSVRDVRLLESLPALVIDEDPRVRESALVAAGRLRDVRAVPMLLARMKTLAALTSPKPPAVGRPGRSGAKAPVEDGRPREQANRELGHLHEALGLIGDVSVVKELQPRIAKVLSTDGHVRATAIWAIGQLLKDKGERAIASAMLARASDPANDETSESGEVRVASAAALGVMKSTETIPGLKTLVADETTPMEVRMSAWWSCVHMGVTDLRRPTETIRPPDFFLAPVPARP